MKIIIPGTPLSDNHLYGHRAMGKRVIRYMTQKGKDYKVMAKGLITEGIKSTDKPIKMWLDVYFGDRRKRDVQGHLKAVIDAFEGILYDNDAQIIFIAASKNIDLERPRVEMTIEEEDD